MLALSTAFFGLTARSSWKKILSQTKAMGFGVLELNVEVPEAMLPEILRSVEQGEIRVASLHNYCPRLEPVPPGRTVYTGYLLTSDSTEERDLAVAYTRRTIEWAGRLGARAVVIHAGEVPTDPSGREFFRYVQQFGRQSRMYERYRNALMADREKKAPAYLDLLSGSLEALLPEASRAGVVLGLENRFFPSEMPDIGELVFLLDRFKGAPVAYWHDVGHAEIFARQGWVRKHTDFLEPLARRMAGIHLHDLRGLSDHHAPGTGDFDFTMLVPYLSPDVLRVVEAHPKSGAQEVKQSVAYLREKGIDRAPSDADRR